MKYNPEIHHRRSIRLKGSDYSQEGMFYVTICTQNREFLFGEIVQWFKTMLTNEYIRGVKKLGWRRFDGKLWQRNYWERIIQDSNIHFFEVLLHPQ